MILQGFDFLNYSYPFRQSSQIFHSFLKVPHSISNQRESLIFWLNLFFSREEVARFLFFHLIAVLVHLVFLNVGLILNHSRQLFFVYPISQPSLQFIRLSILRLWFQSIFQSLCLLSHQCFSFQYDLVFKFHLKRNQLNQWVPLAPLFPDFLFVHQLQQLLILALTLLS